MAQGVRPMTLWDLRYEPEVIVIVLIAVFWLAVAVRFLITHEL